MENNKRKIEKIEPKLGLSHAKLILNMTGGFKMKLVTGEVEIIDYFRFSEKAASCFLDLLKKDKYVISKLASMKKTTLREDEIYKTSKMDRVKVELTAITMLDHQPKPLITAKSNFASKFKKLFKK